MKTSVSILIISVFCFLFNINNLTAKDEYKLGETYVIRLYNGDILSGELVEFVNSETMGEGIKINTQIGKATIYLKQAVEIIKERDYYRHSSRVYLLPTGEPIKNNHYVADIEGAIVIAGAGFQDWLSVFAGRSIIPSLRSDEQLTLLNVKATILHEEFESVDGDFFLALGYNYASVNNDNKITHAYISATYRGARTRITFANYMKLGAKDLYTIKGGTWGEFDMAFSNGAYGMAIGIDTKFSERHDFHFIGEIWNSNVSKPSSTGLALGFRLCNSDLASDFGLAFTTSSAVIPFIGVSWTPF